MVFSHQFPGTIAKLRIPILGGLHILQSIQLTDVLQPFVNKLPGTGLVGIYLAVLVLSTPAGTVE